jgi:hypothetical protein
MITGKNPEDQKRADKFAKHLVKLFTLNVRQRVGLEEEIAVLFVADIEPND